MAVTVGNVVRIVALMQLNGVSDVVNVYHFVVNALTAASDLAFMTDVAVEMDALYTLINASIVDNVTYQSIDGQNITDNELLPSVAWPVLTAGLSGGNMMPEMDSACVFHRTATPRVRASKFLPPVGDGNNTDGVIGAILRAALIVYGDRLTLGLISAAVDLSYVAFNRTLGTTTPVTQAIVPQRWRTQRRRRIGVGS